MNDDRKKYMIIQHVPARSRSITGKRQAWKEAEKMVAETGSPVEVYEAVAWVRGSFSVQTVRMP